MCVTFLILLLYYQLLFYWGTIYIYYNFMKVWCVVGRPVLIQLVFAAK